MLLQSEKEFLKIKIICRTNPDSQDYWDGNWLKSEISLTVLGFKGNYQTNLR